MSQTKTKNPNEERNSRIASFVISLGIHLLLFILFALLMSAQGGGSHKGGSTQSLAAIDVEIVSAAAPGPKTDMSEVKPEPKPEQKPEPVPEPTPEPEVTPETQPVVEPEVKPEPVVPIKPEPKPEVKPQPKPEPKPEPQPAVVEHSQPTVEPEETGGNEGAETAASPNPDKTTPGSAETTGEGSDRASDDKGTGKTDHEGTGTSYGPFPTGSFGLGKTPDCKKDDANNDSLWFTFSVEYRPGDIQPTVSMLTSAPGQRYEMATVLQTRRMIADSFDPSKLPAQDNVVRQGIIDCLCGSKPRCVFRQSQ